MGGLSQVHIRLLGGLTVEGLDEREIGSRKGRTLLKVLATAKGAPLTTDRLADVLWGEELPARPADQVGVLVSRLRAVLGADRLPRTDAGYALRFDWLDLEELEARVAEAERRHAGNQVAAARAAAEAALALVRGPLLPEEDGAWVDAERAAVDVLIRRARVVLAEAALDVGEHGAAAAAAEALLADDPYDEVALRALMRAHVVAGRPASALAAYVRVRERLAEDLGVSPTPATESLHDSIVVGAPGRPRLRQADAVPELPGRGGELARMADILTEVASGGTALVLVVGEPGIGKTALLDAFAAVAARRGFATIRCEARGLGRELPLQPVLDGVASALRELATDAGRSALGSDAAVLQPLLAGDDVVGRDAATVLTDAAAGRAVLFASLLAVVERLSGGAPLLLAIDDIDRADAVTVEWLDFFGRRAGRTAIVATASSSIPGARLRPDLRLELGPLDLSATALVVGDDRAAELHERSGGNPLFLVELARSDGGLPATIREAVTARVEELDVDAAETVRTGAALGPELDLDLLADILGRPVASLLDDADAGTTAGLLRERGTRYVFAHELVREAIDTGLTAARRAFVRRRAAQVLIERPGVDPLTVAWHAEEGGDAALAASALLAAANQAAKRYDHKGAEAVLGHAIALADGAEIRLARARIRMAIWDVAGATTDADAALALDAGASAYEVAGWAAYYGRDYDRAQRYADEGAERATDEAVRASCLALAGRTRHARGELDDAEPRLREAAECRVAEVRSVAQVWLAGLRAHQGDSAGAHDLAERALLEPDRFAHPFGTFHGQFYRALAVGMQGRAQEVATAAAALEEAAAAAGAQGARFVRVAKNLRAWPLRAVGRTGEAVDVLEEVISLCDRDVPAMAEPRRVALLDLADCFLDAGRTDAATTRLDAAAVEIEGWSGTMAWRARQRLDLLRARLDLAAGEFGAAREGAALVAAEAAAAGNGRHSVLAKCVGAEAAARGGWHHELDLDHVEAQLRRLGLTAGLEAWAVTARLADACGVGRWRVLAERRAAELVAGAGALADDARRHVARSLT